MTIDKSLKVKAGAIKNRNVLTRAERITKLIEADRWKEGDKVLGLPKVRVVKISMKKKKKAKAEEGAEALPGQEMHEAHGGSRRPPGIAGPPIVRKFPGPRRRGGGFLTPGAAPVPGRAGRPSGPGPRRSRPARRRGAPPGGRG